MEKELVAILSDNKMEPIVTQNQTEPLIKVEQTEELTEKEDPFAYLDRNDFTSEKYKIEVRNLPKHYGIAVSKYFMNYSSISIIFIL